MPKFLIFLFKFIFHPKCTFLWTAIDLLGMSIGIIVHNGSPNGPVLYKVAEIGLLLFPEEKCLSLVYLKTSAHNSLDKQNMNLLNLIMFL